MLVVAWCAVAMDVHPILQQYPLVGDIEHIELEVAVALDTKHRQVYVEPTWPCGERSISDRPRGTHDRQVAAYIDADMLTDDERLDPDPSIWQRLPSWQNESCPICYTAHMPKRKPKPTGKTQARKSNVSLYLLSPAEALRAVLNIGKDDVKRILASAPGKKRKA